MHEELYASEFVCQKMIEWGIPFERGIAGTGGGATIEGQHNGSGHVVASRADMDALNVTEASGKPWISQIPGKTRLFEMICLLKQPPQTAEFNIHLTPLLIEEHCQIVAPRPG